MTNEERHIAVLDRMLESMDAYDSIQPTTERKKAIKAAIKALEQQPSDTVSRGAFEQVMWERDVAIGQLKELGYGLGQKVEPCDGAISRQAVLERAINVPIAKRVTDNKVICRKVVFVDDIENLPPVTPKQKYGKWIYDETLDNWRCSKCNETPKTMGYVGTADFMAKHFKFCNHCGCRMIEPQESEDKDADKKCTYKETGCGSCKRQLDCPIEAERSGEE